MQTTKQKWDIWELIAIKYLQKNWYKIIDTNFKFGRFWEIDIVCEKEGITCFVEVKYRNNLYFWEPEEAITKSKLHKFKKTIDYYVVTHRLDFEKIRFDVITILKWKESYKVKHYKNLEI
jgi:putative endonuclease